MTNRGDALELQLLAHWKIRDLLEDSKYEVRVMGTFDFWVVERLNVDLTVVAGGLTGGEVGDHCHIMATFREFSHQGIVHDPVVVIGIHEHSEDIEDTGRVDGHQGCEQEEKEDRQSHGDGDMGRGMLLSTTKPSSLFPQWNSTKQSRMLSSGWPHDDQIPPTQRRKYERGLK